LEPNVRENFWKARGKLCGLRLEKSFNKRRLEKNASEENNFLAEIRGG